MPEAEQNVCSVSELNQRVRQLLGGGVAPLWLRGEVTGLTVQAGSGHAYFALKDAACQVNAVFFRGGAQMTALAVSQGMQIDVYGRPDLYERGGIYQFAVQELRLCGQGALHQRFLELKQRLEEEGLFDPRRKRPLPALPECIGLVTSLQGAAIQDFTQVLFRRHPSIRLRIVNTPVQGEGCAARIARAIAYLNETQACSVIVLTRGGGSIEDLWEFNAEVLARAIYASDIPVISAVGHERDFTIADFVADLRAATPSVAAELVVPKQEDFRGRLDHLSHRLQAALRQRLQGLRLRWQRADACAVLRQPQELVWRRGQRLDLAAQRLSQTLPQRALQLHRRLEAIAGRLPAALRQRLAERQRRLHRAGGVLQAVNPTGVLQRGYCILLKSNGQAVRTPVEVAPAEPLTAILAAGRLPLRAEPPTREDVAHG